MEWIVLTPEVDKIYEQDAVNKLFAAGLHRLHLRKPNYTYTDYKNYLSTIPDTYRQNVVIHGSWELYHEQMCGGIHFRAAVRNSVEAIKLMSNVPHHVISTSFHSWQEVIDEGINYGSAFISPLFDSISKQGYKAAVPINGIMATKATFLAANKTCPKIIGLGGIDRTNVAELQKYSYNGAALLGAIWQATDPVAAFENIKNSIG